MRTSSAMMPLKLELALCGLPRIDCTGNHCLISPQVVFNAQIIRLITAMPLVAMLLLLINLPMWIKFQDLVFFNCLNSAKREGREKLFPFFPFIVY